MNGMYIFATSYKLEKVIFMTNFQMTVKIASGVANFRAVHAFVLPWEMFGFDMSNNIVSGRTRRTTVTTNIAKKKTRSKLIK